MIINSIRNINIDYIFYNNYKNLLNEFRITNIDYNFLIEYINSLPYNQDILIAFDNSYNIIGTITIIFERKLINNGKSVCHIEDLIVSKLYKNKGFGSKILEHVKNYAFENNCYKIILNCNNELKKFYEKNYFNSNNIEMSLYITNK